LLEEEKRLTVMGDLGRERSEAPSSAQRKKPDVTHSVKKTHAIWVRLIGLCSEKLFPHEFMGNLQKEGDILPSEGCMEVLFSRI
jgi:hypothetical protein